jgi:large repetitive protein
VHLIESAIGSRAGATRWATCMWLLLVLLASLAFSAPAAAQSADLQVSEYSSTPNPIGRGGTATFTIRSTNNGPAAANSAVVTIDVSPAFEVLNNPGSAFPASCTLSGAVGAQTLSCPLAAFASGADTTFTYDAIARVVGSPTTRATIAPPAGVTGLNPANDFLDLTPTVQSGTDLSVSKSADRASYPGGDTVIYTLQPRLGGPDTTASIRVTDNLPPQVDLDSVTVTNPGGGALTNWSCTVNAGVPNVVCNYTGSAPAAPGFGGAPVDLPAFEIRGRVARGISGTITNSAFTTVTSGTVLEINPANDSSGNVVVSVTPGADLRAEKSMAPNPVSTAAPVTLTLTIRNLGPASVTGATIVDAVPAGFVIGTLPAGCAAVGQQITCTAGTISGSGAAAQTFTIPLTAPAAAASGTNTATVAPPVGITDPVAANDTASFAYVVQAPFADLAAAKTKTGGPVGPGATLTSTIQITNSASSLAAASYSPVNPLVVTEEIGANEQFTGVVTAGWTCAPAGTPGAPVPGPATITCTSTGTGSIAIGASLSLQLTTTPLNIGATPPFPTLTNTACVGSTAGSQHTPADPASGPEAADCASAGVLATTRAADLSLAKEVNTDGGATWGESVSVGTGDSDYFIRLSVTHVSGDEVPTVTVTDTLPNFLDDAGFTSTVTFPSTDGATCSRSGATVTCSFTNFPVATTRRIVIRVQRPFESGSFVNTATVSSPDAVDATPGNNSDTASIDADPIADVTIPVDGKTVNPDPVTVGQLATYTISFRNLGPNPADNVLVSDLVDLARFEVIAGSITTTAPDPAPGGAPQCQLTGPFVTCEAGTLARGQNYQMSFQVRPRYPFGPGGTSFPISHTNTAVIATSTFESNGGNNSDDITHQVLAPDFDLLVTKTEPPGGDPLAFEDPLVYRVRIQNGGPSRATDVRVTDLPAPPAGYSMTPTAAVVVGASTNAPGRTPVCTLNAPAANQVRCVADAVTANSYLDAGEFIVFELTFASTGPPPGGTLTYSNSAQVAAEEAPEVGAPNFDRDTANNVEGETTTVLPRTDLEVVSKTTVTASPVSINQPVIWQVVVRNNGPSATAAMRLVDALPPGFVRTATPVTASAAGAASVTSPVVCSGTSTLTCDLVGSFTPGAGNTITLSIEGRAAYPYSGALGTAVVNTATIQPGVDGSGNPVSRDNGAGNNSQTSTVSVQRSSLAGRVYADDNRNNAFDAGEALAGVRVTITGTDLFGNALPAGTFATTDAAGNYLFDRLPPGNYTLVEDQPAGRLDSTEFAGSVGAGATAPNTAIAASVCPPAANCGSGAAQNTIAAIALPAGTQATGYDFQEVTPAQLSGFVYVDANNDGQRGAGETGINGVTTPVTIRLTGTDYAGNAVNVTQTISSTGAYSFTGLAPSDASGYTLTQVNEPSGFIDGRDQNGAGAGNVIASSAGRPVGETITVGVVNPGAALTERNFGELQGATLAGSVYVDVNANATRDGGEAAVVPGVTVTLSGTNDLGQAVSCPVTTAADGSYLFPTSGSADPLCQTLRPGSYTLTLTPPGGLTVTGAFAGSAGGGGQPANTPLPGASSVGSVTIGSGTSATSYNFGVQGQGLSGAVYVDSNGNGVRDVGEPGIAGVSVTVSGTTAGGQDVCAAINPSPCTAVTNASGAYEFLNLPASNASGYTLTEQAQATPPLTNYGDGVESVGTVGGVASGTAGNDVISGIVLGTGQLGVGYDFGERPAGLSGSTYIDLDNDGVRDAGEPGIGGVVISIAGTTADGRDVCTLIASCSVTTAADGSYTIADLPAGSYTLTQTQPANYADGTDTAGSIGGSTVGTPGAPGTSVISAIVVPPGGTGTGYDFGELAAGLAGRVCIDAGNDGCDAGDAPLAGVTLTLTGVAVDGTPVNLTTTTAADGSYAFTQLPTPNAQGYTVTQAQPDGYASTVTNTTAGSAGGSVANDAITAIPLPAGANASGYNFGELRADLSLTKSVTPTRLNIGQNVTFTITLTNSGPTLATGVSVSDPLPAGFAFVSANPSTGSYSSATGLWTVGAIANAAVETLTVVATTQPTGPYTNTAQVASSGVPDPDSTPGNSIASEDDQASASVVALAVVTGSVFEDRNGNGVRDPGEPPYVNQPVTITDSTGAVQTVQTDQNGDYRADVAPGPVTLDVVPPPGVRLTTGNDPQTIVVAASPVPTISPPVGYQALGGVSGSVWFDVGSTNRQRDGGDQPLAGWIVELIDPALPPGSAPVRTTTTDATGSYVFTDVPAGTYRIQFRDPDTRVVYGTPVNGEQGSAQGGSRPAPGNERGQLEVTITAGATLPQQSLPVDPSGVVYDAVSRDAVRGAVVTLRPVGVCAGWDPATQVVNASAGGYLISGGSISMTTAANGFYQFLLGTNAPAACSFELVVTPPGAYRAPSTLIPPSGLLDVPAGVGTIAVQPQATAPTVGQSTTYHLQLVAGSGRNNVVRNHIPLDTLVPSLIAIEKTVDRAEGEIGESVRYTLRIRNTQGPRLPLLEVDDRLPLGFRYLAGSARVRLPGIAGTTALADPAGGVGPRLRFTVASGLQPGQTLEITYRVQLGVGAQNGDGINRATARSGAVSSNTAQARVRVLAGVFTSEACVVGKIWLDCNENQIQDPEEVGVPAVRLYFEDGTYLVSDSEGKYSYCGLKPITHVLKVDRSTLPKGAYLGTTGSRNVGDPDSLFVDLRNGELHRADFRIASCSTDVRRQVFGRRPVGEVLAPEVEKGDPVQPNVTLDPERETRCADPRYATDAAYREAVGQCLPPERRSGPDPRGMEGSR